MKYRDLKSLSKWWCITYGKGFWRFQWYHNCEVKTVDFNDTDDVMGNRYVAIIVSSISFK